MEVEVESLDFDFEEVVNIDPFEPKDYVYKRNVEVDDYDRVIVEDWDSDDEGADQKAKYVGQNNEVFPTFEEMCKQLDEEQLKEKIVEALYKGSVPVPMTKEQNDEAKKSWFKLLPRERKFRRPLAYFTRNKDESLGDILSWGWFKEIDAYAIKREYGVQYFRYLADLKTLPYWDMEELVQTPNVTYFMKPIDQLMWKMIKYEAGKGWRRWKPFIPKRRIKYNKETGEKDVTLMMKRPRAMRNMPLMPIEQDFYPMFKWWQIDPATCEAVIVLRYESHLNITHERLEVRDYQGMRGLWRTIRVLDPMWLVNCSKEDIKFLYFSKIVFEDREKEQALQFQRVVNVCYAKDVNAGKMWESSWRDLERKEFLKEVKRYEMIKKGSERQLLKLH